MTLESVFAGSAAQRSFRQRFALGQLCMEAESGSAPLALKLAEDCGACGDLDQSSICEKASLGAGSGSRGNELN